MGMIEASLKIPVELAEIVFGPLDRYIKKIEKTLYIYVRLRMKQLSVPLTNQPNIEI